MTAIAFIVNGRSRETTDGTSLADVLRELGLPPSSVVVELNGDPVDRRAFAATLVRDGDRLEVAQMVGGG